MPATPSTTSEFAAQRHENGRGGVVAPQQEPIPAVERGEPALEPVPETATRPPAAEERPSVTNTRVERPKPSRPGWVRPVVSAIIAAVVVGVCVFGYNKWQFSQSHSSTDDAQIASDVVQISPQVSGTVEKVLVLENQHVKRGDLLVVLDDSTYRAGVDQAKANLDQAVASAKGAGVSVALTSETGQAQVLQAEGLVSQAQAGVSSATADVARATAGVATARASAQSAVANVANARAGVSAAIVNRQRAADAVSSAQAQLATAQAGVRAAQAAVAAQQAVTTRAEHDAQRYQQLVSEGAVSEQAAEAATTTASQAESQLASAREQVASAQAVVAQRQADLNAARDAVHTSDQAIVQARAQLVAAQEQSRAAGAGINQAQAQVTAYQDAVRQANARVRQAQGQLSQANTVPRQVAVSSSAQAQANAKIELARAALEAAELQLGYTRIYAPADGRVSKKTVEVGELVQPGTPLMAILPDSDVWVEANFKETQLNGMKPGNPVDIDVDGVPGRTFHGKVNSIAAGTGATFALLPPDNATGNFTKVVQRVPVKIVLDPNQPGLDQLRAGMSSNVTVSTK